MPAQKTRQRVGIEKIRAYPCSCGLDLRELARVRGEDPDHPTKLLMMDWRGVNPAWEDPVTMAVNAAKPMLTEQDLASIELLIVGTESSADQGKPISTFVHSHLGIQPNCRNFEVKHACYGGTCAAMAAAHWVASGVAGPAKALVIGTDMSRMNLGERYEYLMGSGAVALLISAEPKVVEFELETNAYWTREVGDTFRPTSREEAGNTDESLYAYLEGLDGAYAHFKRKNGFDYDARFGQHIYHVPFSAMSYRAHRNILKRESRMKRAEIEARCERKVAPSLTHSRKFGGIYTAANYIGLMGTIDAAPDLQPGDHISIYSYGSGSGAELYSVTLCPEAKQVVGAARLGELIAARRPLAVAEYEACERERTSYVDVATFQPRRDRVPGLYESHYAGRGLLVLEGYEGYFRHYGWS
ncbi:MAG: hydroxymethylglutaryl-CoA synthase family protein [Deltaproteobacteria bacterium]|nr:hydroxymethylglutaryl-CoA synthase family protein [Deltaproteobacteria bacterium]